MSTFRIKILPFLLIFLYAVFFVTFNFYIVDIRMAEMDYTLNMISQGEGVNRSLGMLARIEFARSAMMSEGGDSREDYIRETKLYTILSSEFFKPSFREYSKYNPFVPVARSMVNTIRFIIGKATIDFNKRKLEDKNLELAFFHERNKRYSNAIKMYENILKVKASSSKKRHYILIHLGYCNAMIGHIDRAVKCCETVINETPQNNEITSVAWKLLDFLNYLKRENAAAKKTRKDPMEYGIRLYKLMNYKTAAAQFAYVVRKEKRKPRTDAKVVCKALFYLARCHEELGLQAKSKKAYLEIIENYPNSREAMDANRRLFIMAEFYEQDTLIARKAWDRMKQFKDDEFLQELQNYVGLIEESEIVKDIKERWEQSKKQKLAAKDTELVQNLARLDSEGITSGSSLPLIVTQAPEVTKRMPKNVSSRKPFFIKRKIDSYTQPLHDHFKENLEEGVDLSGEVTVHFFIKSNGMVTDVSITSSTIRNKSFEKMIISTFYKIQLPKISRKYDPLEINYPLTFHSKND
jgi:tetratricopeptide (TPR) repeat protein